MAFLAPLVAPVLGAFGATGAAAAVSTGVGSTLLSTGLSLASSALSFGEEKRRGDANVNSAELIVEATQEETKAQLDVLHHRTDGSIQATRDAEELAIRNAQLVREQTSVDVGTSKREARKQLGAMRARMGASGMAFGGSYMDVLMDSEIAAEQNVMQIKYAGDIRAEGFDRDGRLARSRIASLEEGSELEEAAITKAGEYRLVAALTGVETAESNRTGGLISTGVKALGSASDALDFFGSSSEASNVIPRVSPSQMWT